jgi:hypothetical protein
VAGAVFGVMGGLSAGLLSTSYAFVQDLPSLPQDSQVKAFGARILRDKYPMATADWDQQQQRREGGK